MKINDKIELLYIVKKTDLANTLAITSQDEFPEVFATSKMIGLMEIAAARLMKASLAKNELSVGVCVNVTHFAPTPNDEKVRVVATYKGMEGRSFKFEVELYDNGGKVAKGTHTRAIVEAKRIEQVATKRVVAKQ